MNTPLPAAESFSWYLDILKKQVEQSVERLDERRGILHIRRHLAATPLFKGIADFKQTRVAMLRAETVEALFDILDNIPSVKNYIIEVYTNELGTDEILIRIGSENRSEAFAKEIKDLFRSKVRVAPSINFESAEYIAKIQMPPMSRKTIKFIDLR